MRNVTTLSLALGAWIATIALAGELPAPIADPVAAYPDNYTVLFEDERVRVLDFRLRRGATEDFHRHPPNVAVFLGDFRIRFRLPDGSVAERVARPGDVAYSPAPVVHSPVNVGDTDAHGILIELKQAAGSAPPGGAVP